MLPAVPVYFVGVGTSTAAAEFATNLGINPKLCFGDEGGAVGDVLGLDKGFKTMWNPPGMFVHISVTIHTCIRNSQLTSSSIFLLLHLVI